VSEAGACRHIGRDGLARENGQKNLVRLSVAGGGLRCASGTSTKHVKSSMATGARRMANTIQEAIVPTHSTSFTSLQ